MIIIVPIALAEIKEKLYLGSREDKVESLQRDDCKVISIEPYLSAVYTLMCVCVCGHAFTCMYQPAILAHTHIHNSPDTLFPPFSENVLFLVSLDPS